MSTARRAARPRTSGAGRHLWFAGYMASVLVLILVATEVGLRWAGFGAAADKPSNVEPHYDKFAPDDTLIWALRPSWEGYELNGAAVRTNSLGLRGAELEGTEPIDARIYFLGDSVTFGAGLNERDSIPARLEQTLRAEFGLAVQVVNGGVPGYSTFQEMAQFERYREVIRPDLALLGFCLNDVTERYASLAQYGGTRFFMGNVDTTVGMSWWRRHWQRSAMSDALGAYMKRTAEQRERHVVTRLWEEPTSVEVDQDLRQVSGELDRLIASTRASGVQLAVVLYPYAAQLADVEGRSAPQRRLRQWLTERSVPTLDLLDSARLRDNSTDSTYFDANHFLPHGARIVADEIAQFVVRAGLIATRAPVATATAGSSSALGAALQGTPSGREAWALLELGRQLGRDPRDRSAHLELGRLLRGRGLHAAADVEFRQARRIREDIEVIIEIGLTAFERGAFDEAATIFREAIELEPTSKLAQFNLGIALLQAGRVEEAIEVYFKAVELDPDNLDGRHNLGFALRQVGRFDEAVAEFRAVLGKAPGRTGTLYELAIAQAQGGDTDGARATLGRLLRIEPNHVAARDSLRQLSR